MGVVGLSGFALAPQGFRSSTGIKAARGMAHFVGVAGDDAADGGGAGQGEALLLTPGPQQDIELVFAEVGIDAAPAADLAHQRGSPARPAGALGGAGALRQGGGVVVRLAQRLPPAIEGSRREWEGVTGGGFAMAFEEAKDVESSGHLFGRHAPKMTCPSYPRKPPDAGAEVLDLHGTPPASECQRFLNLYKEGALFRMRSVVRC